MGESSRLRADRANEASDAALFACLRRTIAALAHSHAVTRAVLRASHLFVDEDDFARDNVGARRAEFIHALETDDFTLDAAWFSRGRTTECRDHQALRRRRDDAGPIHTS